MSALATTKPVPRPLGKGREQHLVVIDDDRHVVTMLEDLFKQEGMRVTSFISSVEARRHLLQNPVGIVITDIKMPEISGLELLREIREQSPSTLVIIITGFSTLETTLEAVELGAFDYFTKPFMVGEVKLVVQRALEQIRLRGENLRLTERVTNLEGEIDRLQAEFKRLTDELETLDREHHPLPGAPHRVLVPHPPLEALRPYAKAMGKASKSEDRLELLRDLLRRGILSEDDFEKAKRDYTDE